MALHVLPGAAFQKERVHAELSLSLVPPPRQSPGNACEFKVASVAAKSLTRIHYICTHTPLPPHILDVLYCGGTSDRLWQARHDLELPGPAS